MKSKVFTTILIFVAGISVLLATCLKELAKHHLNTGVSNSFEVTFAKRLHLL